MMKRKKTRPGGQLQKYNGCFDGDADSMETALQHNGDGIAAIVAQQAIASREKLSNHPVIKAIKHSDG